MAFFWVRHFHPGGSSFPPPPPRLTGLEWRAFFINNSKTIKGIRLIFSGLIEVQKVYLQCKAWLSSYCSFCVILNSTKVRHFRPGRRYILFSYIYFQTFFIVKNIKNYFFSWKTIFFRRSRQPLQTFWALTHLFHWLAVHAVTASIFIMLISAKREE